MSASSAWVRTASRFPFTRSNCRDEIPDVSLGFCFHAALTRRTEGARASRAEIVACAATLRTRGGGTSVSPASCESPPPPLGRAARVRVSDAFHLPPNCYCDRQGIGCHPKGCASTRPERRLHENGGRKPCIASTPASRVRQKTKLPRCYRKSNFSTECGQICLRSRVPVNTLWRG